MESIDIYTLDLRMVYGINRCVNDAVMEIIQNSDDSDFLSAIVTVRGNSVIRRKPIFAVTCTIEKGKGLSYHKLVEHLMPTDPIEHDALLNAMFFEADIRILNQTGEVSL